MRKTNILSHYDITWKPLVMIKANVHVLIPARLKHVERNCEYKSN